MDKRCGTCVHWAKYSNRKTIGRCMAPIPVWVVITGEYGDDPSHMRTNDGTDCPTWAAKEECEANRTAPGH